MLDQFNRVNLLYDFYAALLTDKQKEVLRLYFSDNYSLGEIAAAFKVSRQAVHDLIKRAVKTLEDSEKRLGYHAIFEEQQKLLAACEELLKKNDLGQADLLALKDLVRQLRLTTER